MWYVYLLYCADGTLYCGVTTDVTRRLEEHNAGSRGALAPSRAAGLLRDAGGQGLGAAARMGSEAAAPRPQDCLFAGACGGRIKVVAVSPGLAGRGAGNEGIMACAARCTSFFAVEAGQGLHSARRERNHVDLQV